jgi:hypothetical protein
MTAGKKVVLSPEETARRQEHARKMTAGRMAAKEAKLAGADIDPTEGLDPVKVVRSDAERPERQRPGRNLFNGQTKKLAVHMSLPGFRLYWFNDEGDGARLEAALQSGYEFVLRSEVTLESAKGKIDNVAEDSRVKVVANQRSATDGNAKHAYLMKIPMDWYEEDQREADARLQQSERAMISGLGSNADAVERPYIPGFKEGTRKKAIEMTSNLARRT